VGRSSVVSHSLSLIFLSAWTLDYWQGWVFLGTILAPLTLITVWMAAYDRNSSSAFAGRSKS
jgi:hypothetical protein